MNDASQPTQAHERIQLLDAVRGFALFGIMFVNMTWFTGFAVLSSQQKNALGTARIDEVTNWLIEVFIAGKFWTIFAFLFGVGAAIHFQRFESKLQNSESASRAFKRLYIRRLVALLLIGLLHAILIWFGDIVSLYAASGFALLFFINRPKRSALHWGCVLMLAPILQLGILLFIDQWVDAVNPQVHGHGPAELLPYFASGSYRDVLLANWAFLTERWWIALYDGRFFKLAGLFLLGWWSGSRGHLSHPSNHKKLLSIISITAVLVGIPANLFAFSFVQGVALRPPSLDGWLMESVKAIAIPILSLGYVSTISLFYLSCPNSRLARCFAVAGRLSLTNYVLQSLVGVTLFYGYGFQWWGMMGVTWSFGAIVLIFTAQVIASWTWLQFFSLGPLEWLWRCMVYRKLVQLQNTNRDDSRFAVQNNRPKNS